jgi:hypothetical protein
VGSTGIPAQDSWWIQDELSILDAPLDEEDSLRESRGGFHLTGSSTPTSSTARSWARWDDRTGIGLQWARSQPGGLRRRRIESATENVSWSAGDLDPWNDAPLLEGVSRQWGPSTLDEQEAWRRGSGKLPNGLESQLRRGSVQVRSRWREDRRKAENHRSGTVELGWRQFHAGLRSEQPADAKGATLAWRDSVWNVSGLATAERFGGFRVQRASRSEGHSGEARWVSGAVRHSGLPSGWSGTTAMRWAWDNPDKHPMFDGFRLEATRRERTDRALARSKWRIVLGPVQTSLRPALVWSSPGALHAGIHGRLQRTEPGLWQPSLEAAWSDTISRTGMNLAGSLAWSGNGRRTSVGAHWREEESPQISLQQSGSVRSGKHGVELSLQLRSEWKMAPQVWAQGGISCAW